MRAFFISGICLFWLWYVWHRHAHDPGILDYWGFRKENFGKSLVVLMPFFAICLVFMLLNANQNQFELLNPNMLPIFLLYPIWGVVQQFMMVAIVAEIIKNIRHLSNHIPTIVILTSGLFSLIHYPDLGLMIFTLAMEVVLLTAYFKWRNLWAIGIVHGWIATFLLYYVHNRDLWTELFAWFQI